MPMPTRAARRSRLLFAGLVVLAGVLSCAAPAARPSAAPVMAADSRAAPPGGPLERLTPAVQELLDEMSVPGAVVLVDTGGDRYLRAFGTRRIGADDPVGTGDHFRIGSITKTMTGTALLQLAGEGRVALTDPVSKYRPEVPGGDRITLAELLEMRSGLASYTTQLPLNQAADDDPARIWSPDELAAMGTAVPPVAAPGEEFYYSNTNTVLAGLVVEQVTGQDLRTVLQERVFTPLGLTSTSFPAPADAALPVPYPQGYLFGTNVSTLSSPALPEAEQRAAAAGTLRPNDVTGLNPSWAWAAGAAISTAEDLAVYAQALVDGRLLPPAVAAERTRSVRPIDPADPASPGYGLALARFGPMLGHDGSLPGYQSFMGHDPKTGATLVVLTDLQAAPDGRETANTVAMKVLELL
ncbi:serine hydrolase domain-containing protein [Pseudonocardia nematodicida]|uniref:Serine hydrolase domain-containing protein n=1 Tax=Pseudonocardia nematodicida TaxID=1206997 RepID=A0ABV1KCT9_9PSEU